MLRWNFFGAGRREELKHEEKKLAEDEEAQQKAENLLVSAMERPGKFEEAISSLDDLEGATAKRLLGWAAWKAKPPDVIRKIGERCGGDISGWALDKCSAIQLAVRGENVGGIRELLSMGADVNTEADSSSLPTALHWAVFVGSLECLEVLLERPEIKVDAANSVGFTALHLCSTYACIEDPQHHVTEEVFAEIAAALMRRGASTGKRATAADPPVTPLETAVSYNACLIVAKMLELGEKPPARTVERLMASLREAGEEHANMLEVFVKAGCGPRVVDDGDSRAAAALRGIPNALKASSSSGSSQPSSGNRAQPQRLPLHDAAKSGNAAALAGHLSSGADVNAVDKRGGTALHAAAMHGHDDVVEVLLRADGIIIDKPDNLKLTALFKAAVADQVGAVKALLKAGASPRAKDHNGGPLLHTVVARPAGPVLEALLAHGASPGAGGEKGYTPLHVACRNGATGTVEALLRNGALPGHCWNESGESPLVLACRHGNLNAVQQLLPVLSKRQRNTRSAANAGAETALGAAIRCADLTTDTVAIVEALLEAEADPHTRTGPTQVPPLALVLATKPDMGAVNGVATNATIGPLLVQALVAGGADVNQLAIDNNGFTPLQLACQQGACVEVIQALLDAGADMHAPCLSSNCTTPLLLAACYGGDPGVVRFLISQPQSGGLNAVGGIERDTPLAAAVQGGQTEVVRFLLEEGADMDLLPYKEDGKTAITSSLVEVAARRGHMDVMRLLIQAKMFKDKAEQQTEDVDAKGLVEAAPC